MRNLTITLVAIAVLASTTTGCATRRYVRNRTEPLDQHVGELDKKTAENAGKIGEVDEKASREISRVGEKASAADARAGEAGRQATEAMTKGTQAMERAESARSAAENSMAKASSLEKYMDSYDNFQPSTSKTILFGFDKWNLNADAKKDLDELATNLANAKKYVVEVQGFTDTTGPANYNYSLSERRAATVVRYLTEQHKIPVYRVHTIGLGKDMPAQAENRREARKLSRRVEVKVYTRPELPQTAQQVSPTTTPSPSTQPTEPRPPENEQPQPEQNRENELQRRP